jgi:ribosomal protein S18 acetylase RimI-like enzyme
LSAGSRSIHVAVPPQAIWDLLVAPGLRDWYYRLTPQGDFRPGSRIRWMDVAGALVEESEVLEIDRGARLVMHTRFVFAPTFAAAAPHTTTWAVAPDEDGSEVRLSWEADGPAARLLAAEADIQLKGLRLAADPAARAELVRLPQIGAVEVRDVTPDMVDDYLDFFDHHAFRDFPEWQACYCMETHRTQDDDEWAQRTAEDNRRDMSKSIRRGHVTGLLAFEGGKPIGWCDYGETTRLSGLMRRFGLDVPEHEGVGSVACFVIASQYRGHGVASQLLDAAVERLRTRGLRAVEAYPARSDDSPHTNYRGPLAMFLRAGFEPYGEVERHLIVRKLLA